MMQVTNFQDSGYSIGISCSLLLADPLFVIRFLRQWAHTHRRITAGSQLAADPVFYLTNLKPSRIPANLTAISAAPQPASTLLFRVPSTAEYLAGDTPSAGGNFTVFRSDHAGGVKVEFLANGDGGGKAARWEELGAGELELGENNAPVGVSHRIVMGGDGTGVVVAMVAGDGSDVLVSVTVPVSGMD